MNLDHCPPRPKITETLRAARHRRVRGCTLCDQLRKGSRKVKPSLDPRVHWVLVDRGTFAQLPCRKYGGPVVQLDRTPPYEGGDHGSSPCGATTSIERVYQLIRAGHSPYWAYYIAGFEARGVQVCDSLDHNEGCTNTRCPVWGHCDACGKLFRDCAGHDDR